MFREVDTVDVVSRGRVRQIVLAEGDLARITTGDDVDILVVSAFPDNYAETPTSLIGQLARQGVSVGAMAHNKARDLRASTGLWLSRPLPDGPFRWLACFEPQVIGAPPDVVGELFRGLMRVLEEDGGEVSVAMPLVSTGDAGWPEEAILPPLLKAASAWLRIGLPVRKLTIVIRDAAVLEMARAAFAQFRAERGHEYGPVTGRDVASEHFGADRLPMQDRDGTRVFLSFSSCDAEAVDQFAESLRAVRPGLTVFDFRRDISLGLSYQTEVDDALGESDRVVAFLSPDYMASGECVEELLVARWRNKREGFRVLIPVYWREIGEGLDLWIQILNYADCCEADQGKLDDAAARVLSALAD